MIRPEFTPVELGELEVSLIEQLRSQGKTAENIRLIGLKGKGYHASVFSVLIDDEHHVLKVYYNTKAYEREIKNLRQQIPLDRHLFAWDAKLAGVEYKVVAIEVPDGRELTYNELTPQVAESLAKSTLNTHQLRYRKKVSARALKLRLKEKSVSVMAHLESYPESDLKEVEAALEAANKLLRAHSAEFRVQSCRCHGDLWWSNVIVAEEDVYLIDWESVKRDDYAEDLAKFRIMADYHRQDEPVVLWVEGYADYPKLDHFMDIILGKYEATFDDKTLDMRYGFYGFLIGFVIFGDFYYGDKRGSEEAMQIMRSGIAMLTKYCL